MRDPNWEGTLKLTPLTPQQPQIRPSRPALVALDYGRLVRIPWSQHRLSAVAHCAAAAILLSILEMLIEEIVQGVLEGAGSLFVVSVAQGDKCVEQHAAHEILHGHCVKKTMPDEEMLAKVYG